MSTAPPRVPRNKENDYTPESAADRREFLREQTGASLDQVGSFSFDPGVLAGNVENYIGVAQVPIGVAGPLRINGEHARGEFYVPLATTEGTLVASYNRGMRLLSECGGVKTTVVDDQMQRAPAFIFDDAQQAREFGDWMDAHCDEIRAVAEETTRSGKLTYIGHYQVGPLRYLRVNYTTGDAAGQNMTGKATYAACEWIKANYPGGADYVLSGAIDTDKKHSQINMLLTRGKRVVAEAVIKNDVLQRLMGVDTKTLYDYRQIGMVGGFLAGSSYNGAHAANGLTAIFIATGQDVANISEAHAGITYARLRDNGDYYWSVTLTSLIIATYGGGTSLPTQREGLELLGCYGEGKVRKLAEICAATVLAGDTSLTAAILAGHWVSSHERLGRNR
ncbi:MAG TPA: hydroxymethylglutaryl-CoA reductase [Solirubrobacteraceae bacterium]|jgi:hydroxymethylglutaryl-CoA reductase (NADPH)|nr:hydroxymethylglutaryl-CoA reductase [Solirubrobacteraceae bacterium]